MATGTIVKNTNYVRLWSQLDLPQTATTYNCNWQDCKVLVITVIFYGNRMSSVIIPRADFASTQSQSRILMVVQNITFELWQNGAGKISAFMSDKNAAYGLLVEGLSY